MTEKDLKKLETIFKDFRRDKSSKDNMMAKFSIAVGEGEDLMEKGEENNEDNEKDVIYKLQKDCGLNIMQGTQHCTTLDLEKTSQIWKALQSLQEIKEDMKLVIVGDGGAGNFFSFVLFSTIFIIF